MYCINLIFLVAWFYGLKPILRIGFSKRCIGCDKDRKGFNQDVFETLIKTLVTFSSKLSRCY
jgi:hypothetical protein